MITWSFSPILVSFGPIAIRWYGLFFIVGFWLGYLFMMRVCRFEKKSIEVLDSLLVYLILGTTIGARLGHCLFYEWDYFQNHLLEIPMIWHGGLASHGGILGVLTALFLFSRRHRDFPLMWLFDRIAIPTALTGCFIRLGNLMNSEILGKPTDGTWGVIFTRVDSVARHPAMVYESVAYFCIWLSALYLYRLTKRLPPSGFIFGWCLAWVFISRMIIEHWKINQESFEEGMLLNMGQLLSIPFIIVGIWLFIRGFRAWKKQEQSL